ncbi:MAG TPA: sugar phosphate isomerase, partial [Lentisphaeria bacterium]|nr:sugar phosphate isomerase [Lentisphaeria bacterium]
VRSVESFEDYESFGRRQVRESGLGRDDVLVAITEGGETSSVLGTVAEAAARGAGVFLLFNNPAELLASRLERCRQAITDPRVCVLDLHCGPMALAGSTRMQATTSEQLIAGAALETVLHRLIGKPERDYAADFGTLLDALEAEANVQAIADYMAFEAD